MKWLVLLVIVIGIFLLGVVACSGLTGLGFSEKTNDTYVIPYGYEGSIYVFSDVPGAAATLREEQFDIFPINDEGFFVTSTSAERLGFGIVTDTYVYVDSSGVRYPIPENCVRTLATGSRVFSPAHTELTYEFSFRGIEITKNRCGPDFQNQFDATGNEKMLTELLESIENLYK